MPSDQLRLRLRELPHDVLAELAAQLCSESTTGTFADPALWSDNPELMAAAAAAAAASPNPNRETAAVAAAAASMHRVTGTFVDPSHESAFAAQLFRMAYPTHVLLMALVLAVYTWMGLIQPDMRAHWAALVLCVAIPGLVCRVLLHSTQDPVR